MKRNGLVKKILGGVLALGIVAAVGMGSTASAAGFDHGRYDRGRYVVVERPYRPVFPRFRFDARFFHPRCW